MMKRDTNRNSEQAGAETPAVFDEVTVRRQYHEFPPVYNEDSRILILGSFPSVKSRAQAFYYGHPQNRFWKVLAAVAGEQISDDTEERRQFLLRRGVALWDVLESCEIHGSSDASIRAAEPVDIERITELCSIEKICVNGSTAKKYYDRYLKRRTGREAVLLPSTSPANAAWSLARLTEAWRAALGDCI